MEDDAHLDQGSLLAAFAERTSAHGVARLAQGSVPQRLLWLLIIVGASCGFGFHLNQLVSRFNELPVTTSFSSEELVQFPWVTICPTDFINQGSSISATVNGVPVKTDPKNYISNSVSRLYHRLLDDQNWNNSVPVVVPERFQDAKISLRSQFFKSQSTYQGTHETVIYCEFSADLCSFLNFSIHKDEKYFACATFTPVNRTMAQAGEDGSLFLLLYHNGDTFYTLQKEMGNPLAFKVALHEPGTKPDMSTALTVPLGYKTTLEFKSTIDDSIDRSASPCIQSMSNVTYTTDYSRPGDFENVTFYGSVQDCINRVKQEEFVRECSCLGDHLAIPADMMQQWPLCHELPDEVTLRDIKVVTKNPGGMSQYEIVNNSMQYVPLEQYLSSQWAAFSRSAAFVNCYHTVRQRQSAVGVNTLSCPKLCRTVRYSAVRTSDTWPAKTNMLDAVTGFLQITRSLAGLAGRTTDKLKQMGQLVPRELDRYYCILSLSATSIKVTTSKEDYAYTLKNVFSDLGGILGLWVGISVITLMEVVELTVQVFHICLLRLNNRKTVAASVSAVAKGGISKMTD